MTTNKGVNRTFLITFLIYVGGSFLGSLIGKRFVDSFYVDIAFHSSSYVSRRLSI